jgi:4-diphosphocytidyl-2-C-methyl-D-erythritol kinase
MKRLFFSPAKINLFLRIEGKRTDGYHEISSLFQTISLGDCLSIELSDQDQLTCSDSSIPTDASNLVSKAVLLFRRKTGWQHSVKIHLDKKIPSQAGLGGGSSNAATALWALNALTEYSVDIKELETWGAELGSDVPFFFSEGTALCTGRGEHIHPLAPLSVPPFWIIKPFFGASTPEVYKRVKADLICEERMTGKVKDEMLTYFNDLESPAFEAFPALQDLKRQLIDQGFEIVLMSGSGSAFFCMGSKTGFPPQVKDTTIFSVEFLNRKSQAWYECSNF